jgi:hydroxymethylbilane synthase
VDTRLRKLEEGQYKAIILAAAGLNRLGLTARVREVLAPELVCPAVGQGALGIECRSQDNKTKELLRFLDDSPTHTACDAERALLRTLGGGCQVPIGAHAVHSNGKLRLNAVVARPDGSLVLREQQDGNEPETLGVEVGRALLKKGADAILQEVYGEAAAVPQQP